MNLGKNITERVCNPPGFGFPSIAFATVMDIPFRFFYFAEIYQDCLNESREKAWN